MELRPRRHRLRAGAPRRPVAGGRGGFRPARAAQHRSGALQADRADDHRPVRLARGRGRHQHPRPAVGRDPRRGRRLCVSAPALGAVAAARGDRAGDRAGPARAAARLVHRRKDLEFRRGDPQVSRNGEGLSAERPAAGAAVPGHARVLPPGQPCRDAGAAWPRRAARLLRGGGRRRGRRRLPRRWAACWRPRTCAIARRAPGRRPRWAGAAALCT